MPPQESNRDAVDLDESQLAVMAKLMNPAIPSMSVRTDAAMKMASVAPDFAGTDAFYEMRGLDAETITCIQSQKRQAQARRGVSLLMEQRYRSDTPEDEGDIAQELAAQLYDEIRKAEGIGTKPVQLFDDVIDEGWIAEKAHWHARTLIDGNRAKFEDECRKLADFYVKRCAFENMMRNCDTNHVRYARVPSGNETCAWCMMFASRGFVYHTEASARGAHGVHLHCDCIVMPGVKGKTVIAGYDPTEWHARWQEAKEGKSEHELMYGVRYDEAMEVEHSQIESEEYARLFEGITSRPDINAQLLKAARRALTRNSGTSFESMTFIDVETGESVTVDSDIPSGVAYTDEVRSFINVRKDGRPRIVTMHNHPNGTPPSADDLSKMSENNYLIGVVAGHNGQVYTYDYHGPILDEKLRDTIASNIAQLCEYGYDVDRAFTEVFEGYGLSYELR